MVLLEVNPPRLVKGFSGSLLLLCDPFFSSTTRCRQPSAFINPSLTLLTCLWVTRASLTCHAAASSSFPCTLSHSGGYSAYHHAIRGNIPLLSSLLRCGADWLKNYAPLNIIRLQAGHVCNLFGRDEQGYLIVIIIRLRSQAGKSSPIQS